MWVREYRVIKKTHKECELFKMNDTAHNYLGPWSPAVVWRGGFYTHCSRVQARWGSSETPPQLPPAALCQEDSKVSASRARTKHVSEALLWPFTLLLLSYGLCWLKILVILADNISQQDWQIWSHSFQSFYYCSMTLTLKLLINTGWCDNVMLFHFTPSPVFDIHCIQ